MSLKPIAFVGALMGQPLVTSNSPSSVLCRSVCVWGGGGGLACCKDDLGCAR